MSRALLNRDPDEVAAELFLRRRSGDWSEADARELAAWLEAAPLHRDCFEGVERMWGAAGEGAGSPAVRAMRAEALAAQPQGRRWPVRSFAAMAASLAVVVAGVGVGLLTQREGLLAPAAERPGSCSSVLRSWEISRRHPTSQRNWPMAPPGPKPSRNASRLLPPSSAAPT